jgi:hypothetical protein
MGGERLDTRNPTSKLMLTILAGVATWEREIMLERQRGPGTRSVDFRPNFRTLYEPGRFWRRRSRSTTMFAAKSVAEFRCHCLFDGNSFTRQVTA